MTTVETREPIPSVVAICLDWCGYVEAEAAGRRCFMDCQRRMRRRRGWICSAEWCQQFYTTPESFKAHECGNAV